VHEGKNWIAQLYLSEKGLCGMEFLHAESDVKLNSLPSIINLPIFVT
jgi:hypothetical protein